jgi:thioredoxin reductase (NADPH)
MSPKGEDTLLDCLIIGGGPAGLIAATYLGRFRRSVEIIDAGSSRASLIPLSHNCPGFAEGITGDDLLIRLRDQASRYGAQLTSGRIEHLSRNEDGSFTAMNGHEAIQAKNVLLATGVIDIEPVLPNLADAIRQGYIRHCPICDGYEVIGQKVAVIGHGKKLMREALFIRHYTDKLTVLSLGQDIGLDEEEHRLLADHQIRVIDEPIAEVYIKNGRIAALRGHSGTRHCFDTLYSALGTKVRSELAVALGAASDGQNCLIVGQDHVETSIPGLYAAGDVVSGLNQISVAAGQAAIAATAIHNRLRGA